MQKTSYLIKVMVVAFILMISLVQIANSSMVYGETFGLDTTEFSPLTDVEREYIYKYLTDVSDTVTLEELKPLLDRALIELDKNRYEPIRQELIERGITSDPTILDVGARWLFCAREESTLITQSNHLTYLDLYGLDVYEDKIIEFIRTGEGIKALYDLQGIPRILLPGLEDGSNASKGFLNVIDKAIKTLQDRVPEGVDVVKWLWSLGLDVYFICNFDTRADYMSAFVTAYGRVSSNFSKSDLGRETIYGMMMIHLINESYAIAYARINQATFYNNTFSVDTGMSETIKYWAMSKNAAFLLDVSGLENKDLELVKGAGFYLAAVPETEQRKLVAKRMFELLMMMTPSIDVDGSWDVVSTFDVE